jgi:hypothetical protein
MTIGIPDFNDAERARVAALLAHRYGKQVMLELAESELQLDPDSDVLTVCPTLYWHERGAHFVVCRVAKDRYRCQFFYNEVEQYGTGITDYQDLEACVLMLLRIQSDHERDRAQATAPERSDYQGPEII